MYNGFTIFVKISALKRIHPLLYLSLLFLSACGNIEVFEKDVVIPGQAWKSDFKPVIEFNITDTVSLYDIKVVLRHTDAYSYKNIWMNISVQAPGGDSLFNNRMNLLLADDKQGWLGKGMDDIFENRVSLERQARRFSKTGTYRFTLQQIMREDPLNHVLNVGIRVDRVPQ